MIRKTQDRFLTAAMNSAVLSVQLVEFNERLPGRSSNGSLQTGFLSFINDIDYILIMILNSSLNHHHRII